ncbi:unnamed protein product [Bubo scandiacus]
MNHAGPGAAVSHRRGGAGHTRACRLQKLFGADGDLADEDFLSAVEDAENHCVEPPPRQPPRLALGNLQTPVVTNHLVQLVTAASKAPGAAPCLPPRGKTRRFPGPAGILPQQHAGKLLDEVLVSAPQTPAHGAVAKPRTKGLPSSSPPTEEDFGKGPWLAMKTELGLDERDPGCFLRTYSVVMVLRKAALKQLPKNKVPSMAVMIKTLSRTNVDAGAVFRDPTGEMQGTVHRLLLEERQSELKPGSVLLLKQVGVFSPSHRNHYLNVTPNNLLKIYPPEPEGGFSQPAQREYCRDPAVHNALYTGDLLRIKSIFKDETTTNLIMETVSEELVWSPEQGLWVLSPRRQQTAAAPRPDCTRLLLAFGADPNLLSAEGSAPLHLCTAPESLPCAELLLAHGARVNLGTRERQVTALHVAARQGLVAHVELYLRHGADPARRSHQGETPLNAACAAAERPEDAERYYQVAQRLLEAGADPGAAGRKDHTPLHNACGNGQPRLARLLLRHGADATVPNCAGYTPMDCALHAVEEYRHQRPEQTIALLLDHGAGPVHPKMLKFCCRHPPALEVVLNAYDRVPPAESWVGAVPPELWEEHRDFYASAVRAAGQPHRLQHLARCALRRHLGPRCHAAVPKLALLPPPLRLYLQLPLEGLIS